MSKILDYINSFFHSVESVPEAECQPYEYELVNGKALEIRHYPQKRTMVVCPGDSITATITEGNEVIAKVTEPIDKTMLVDTIRTLRFNDSIGYKHAVGVLFGQRK